MTDTSPWDPFVVPVINPGLVSLARTSSVVVESSATVAASSIAFAAGTPPTSGSSSDAPKANVMSVETPSSWLLSSHDVPALPPTVSTPSPFQSPATGNGVPPGL